MTNSINIISRWKSKNINEITLLNIGAKAKVNNVRTNRENKTDEEEEERQTRGNMAAELSIDDHPQLYVRPLRFTERCSPLSLSLYGSSFHHVRSKYSPKRMSGIIYIRMIEIRVEQIKETKGRDESDLLLKLSLFISL